MATTPKRLADVDHTASADVSSANMLCVSGGHVKQLPGYIQQIDKNKSDIAAMMLKIYPVGAIYISASDINPSTLFGGTWELIKGRFLVGVGRLEENNSTYFGTVKAGDVNCPAGEKGGEAWDTLTVNQMPSHTHDVYFQNDDFNNSAGGGLGLTHDGTDVENNYKTTRPTGGGAAHNNMPPYLAVYMWKRTA